MNSPIADPIDGSNDNKKYLKEYRKIIVFGNSSWETLPSDCVEVGSRCKFKVCNHNLKIRRVSGRDWRVRIIADGVVLNEDDLTYMKLKEGDQSGTKEWEEFQTVTDEGVEWDFHRDETAMNSVSSYKAPSP